MKYRRINILLDQVQKVQFGSIRTDCAIDWLEMLHFKDWVVQMRLLLEANNEPECLTTDLDILKQLPKLLGNMKPQIDDPEAIYRITRERYDELKRQSSRLYRP